MLSSEDESDRQIRGGRREVSVADVLAWSKELLYASWRRRTLYLKFWIVSVGLALLYIVGSTREYLVTTKILPYRSDRTALSGLGGLAGLAGVSIPMGLSGQVVPAELYPEVANSFAFRSDLARRPIHFRDGVHSYAVYFDSVYTPSGVELLVKYSVMLPMTAYEGLRTRFAPRDAGPVGASGVLDSLGIRAPSLAFVEIVEGMKDRVRTVQNRKSGVISISARMPDAVAAADLARLTAVRLTEEIVRHESMKAAEQARFLGEQQRIAEHRYQSVQRAVAEFQDRNKSLSSAVSQVELQRLQSEFSRAFDLYTGISTQYEAARVKQQEDTPVLTVLEPSVVPNAASSPRKLTLLLLSAFVGALMALARVTIEHSFAASVLPPRDA